MRPAPKIPIANPQARIGRRGREVLWGKVKESGNFRVFMSIEMWLPKAEPES